MRLRSPRFWLAPPAPPGRPPPLRPRSSDARSILPTTLRPRSCSPLALISSSSVPVVAASGPLGASVVGSAAGVGVGAAALGASATGLGAGAASVAAGALGAAAGAGAVVGLVASGADAAAGAGFAGSGCGAGAGAGAAATVGLGAGSGALAGAGAGVVAGAGGGTVVAFWGITFPLASNCTLPATLRPCRRGASVSMRSALGAGVAGTSTARCAALWLATSFFSCAAAPPSSRASWSNCACEIFEFGFLSIASPRVRMKSTARSRLIFKSRIAFDKRIVLSSDILYGSKPREHTISASDCKINALQAPATNFRQKTP